MTGPTVSIVRGATEYPSASPYHPSEPYPEYPFPGATSSESNGVYPMVRELFRQLGYDAESFGSPAWNPLGSLIEPGDLVVIKPNFVISRHRTGGDLFSATTHPSVIRAVVDYAWIALKGSGRIVVADSPQMDCDFEELKRIQGIQAVLDHYARVGGATVELMDLRNEGLRDPQAAPFADNRMELSGDPAGEVVFDLGDRSHFAGLPGWERFYGADFDRQETIAHHHPGHHRYVVSRTVVEADVFISIPKLKVHKKVGVTLNTKGLVGITTNKNCLVHYRLGAPSDGGDQLPDDIRRSDRFVVRIQRWLFDVLLGRGSIIGGAVYKLIGAVYRKTLGRFLAKTSSTRLLDGGNWHGNDSAWRMAVDLLKVLTFGTPEGEIRTDRSKRTLAIVDGVIGGEGNGPLAPDARPVGILVGGESLLAADLVSARLMGFDPARIRQFDIVGEPGFGVRAVEEIDVRSERDEFRHLMTSTGRALAFRPHPGWVGRIEVMPSDQAG